MIKSNATRKEATIEIMSRVEKEIERMQPCDTAALCAHFNGDLIRSQVRHSLNLLRHHGRIRNVDSQKHALWVVLDYVPQDGDGTKKPVAVQKKALVAQDPKMMKFDNLAPPRRVDIMSGTYVPTVTQVTRPGADDHKNCPSLRNGKRIQFSGNFIIDAS